MKNSGIVYLLIISLLLCNNQGSSQEVISQNIRGTVLDKVTGVPLPGANVMITGLTPLRGTVTDNDGNFVITKVPVGRVGLKITYMGYEDVVLYDIDHTSGRELVLTIEMTEKVVSAKEVVISANRDKTATQNNMLTVSGRGFTIEETKRYAGSSNDVGRMAADYAGVTGISDSRNDIIIRGNSPMGLLWRLEGIDIPSPNHWSGFGVTGGPVCMLNNNLLANSDFITAAFPAEYGNAISGVFDLKMRNGNNKRHEFLGQIGFNGFEANAEGPISKKNGSSYLFAYRISTYQVMNKLGMDFGTGTAIPKYQDFSFKVNFPKTKIGQVSLFGLGGISLVAMHDSEKDTNDATTKDLYTSGIPQDLDNGSTTGVIGLNHSRVINKNTYIRTTLAASYFETKTMIDTVTPKTMAAVPYYREFGNEQKYSASINLVRKINSQNNYKAGMMYKLSVFDMTDSVLNNGRFINTADFSGTSGLLQPFFQYQYKPGENLVINTGLHYLHYLFNHTGVLEPRAGVKWKIRPNQSLSLGYGRHSQVNPPTVYFYQRILPDSIHYEQPNFNIDLIKSHHLVAGYTLNINENNYIRAEIYYQYISNAGIYGGSDKDMDVYSLLNQGAYFAVGVPDTLVDGGKGKNYGIELTVERLLYKGFYYLLTASLYDSKFRGSDGVWRNTVFNGNYTLNLLAGKEFLLNRVKAATGKSQNMLFINIKTTFAGGMRYIPIDEAKSIQQKSAVYIYEDAYTKRFKDYSKTDMIIGFKLNGRKMTQEFQLDITNLFNQKNIFMQEFNSKTAKIETTYQMGFMVLPQYRITF